MTVAKPQDLHDQYQTNDFTTENYRSILSSIATQYKFISFEEAKETESFMLWRHDVDISPHRSITLGTIERDLGIKSTFFVQIRSEFYNGLGPRHAARWRTLAAMGHEIGLHFDPTVYDGSGEYLQQAAATEADLLGAAIDQVIKVVSIHNPTGAPAALLESEEIGGRINVYAPWFQENVSYCSDSNGYWRHTRLSDFLLERPARAQVLLHPVWWTEDRTLPRDRIISAVAESQNEMITEYDSALIAFNRENAGKSTD